VTALAPEQVMMNNQRAQATTAQVGAQHTSLQVENHAAFVELRIRVPCGSFQRAVGLLFRHCQASHSSSTACKQCAFF
jgi:hypothetical protein